MNMEMTKKTFQVKWLEPTKLGKTLMEVLLERLIVMYPSAAQNFFITPERIKVWSADWAESFDRNGLTPEHLRRGLIECEKAGDQFMPSLPQFLEYCKEPVIPLMHRDLPRVEHRLTDEERKEGLRRLHIAAAQLTNKSDTKE